MKTEPNLAVDQRSMPMDPSSIYGQGIIQSKSGLAGVGKLISWITKLKSLFLKLNFFVSLSSS